MSYTRWSSGDWYIFWVGGPERKRAEQRLAVWSNRSAETPEITYPVVKKALKTGEWGKALGLPHEALTQMDLLEDCCRQWIADVERRYQRWD